MSRRVPITLLVALVALGLAAGAASRFIAPGSSPPYAPVRGPHAPTDWFYMQRAYPSGLIDPAARQHAVAQARALGRSAAPPEQAGTLAAPWSLLGPINVGGRVTDLVADPNDPATVYVGAASGGVWKTADDGASCSVVLDGAWGASLSIGAIAMNPIDPLTLYVGTGEANAGGGSVAYGGNGVWKTTDGGASWLPLGLEGTASIGRIAVDPWDPSRVFVAATGDLYAAGPERGLYRTTDAGASWQNVLFVSDSTGCVDVAIDSSNPSRVLASMWERTRRPDRRRYGGVTSGIWLSEDGGDSWSLLTQGLPAASTKPGRIGVAIAPSDPSRMYAIYADSIGFFAGFYASTDGGATWGRQNDDDLAAGFFYSSFGWWFGRIWIDPIDADVVWADGILLYRSTTGGNSWSDVGSADMHVDHHAQWIDPSDPSRIWKGNDGGLYRSRDGGGTWQHVTTLPITQFYTNEAHASEPWKVYGGTQDNGTIRTPGGLADDWEQIHSGDGHYVIVDPNDTQVIYAEFQYGNLAKSTDGGASFNPAMNGISPGDRKNWSTPVVVDPASVGGEETTLYYGANRLYRSTNSATSWAPASPDLSDGAPGANGIVYGTITTIAVSPSNSGTIYAGTDDANVWVTTDGGANWSQVDAELPERWITRLAVDPDEDWVAYASVSGFRDGDAAAHVFVTFDWGGSWFNIGAGLPDAPVNDIVVDPTNHARLYVATDVGTYFTDSYGGSWYRLGEGLPDGVIVTDLDYIEAPSPLLIAATYGRGMYGLDLGAATGVEDALLPGGERAGGASAAPRLLGNSPNPWRSETHIRFALARPGRARVEVFDLAGRRVATLFDGEAAAGSRSVRWDGLDEHGRRAASGTYIYRLEAEGRALAQRMTLIR